jgi:hypothetical protein
MRFACWITKASDNIGNAIILIAFRGNNGYANAFDVNVIRTLPVLLNAESGTKRNQWALKSYMQFSLAQYD